VKNVVIGIQDPDVRVSGEGIKQLRTAGIHVRGPVERALCEHFNRGFISVRTKGRPWITLHRAQTLDGRIANPDGSPLKITNDEQDAWTHEFLRARHDAIVVGVQTVIHDDPQLNVRHLNKGTGTGMDTGNTAWQPWKIILDPQLRIPLSAKVVTGEAAKKTMIVSSENSSSDACDEFLKRGVRIVEIPLIDNHFDFPALWNALLTPAQDFYGITSILVEGGKKTWKTFYASGLIDEEVVLVGS
jgi:diaminohydroxyphosphoribosylaminopyrimidine deaminase/5-amino-6-(5-phosphoribosylamino)uracil reductase